MNEAAHCGFEHYAGNFPLWFAPEQMRVITLNDDEALSNYANPPRLGGFITPPQLLQYLFPCRSIHVFIHSGHGNSTSGKTNHFPPPRSRHG